MTTPVPTHAIAIFLLLVAPALPASAADVPPDGMEDLRAAAIAMEERGSAVVAAHPDLFGRPAPAVSTAHLADVPFVALFDIAERVAAVEVRLALRIPDETGEMGVTREQASRWMREQRIAHEAAVADGFSRLAAAGLARDGLTREDTVEWGLHLFALETSLGLLERLEGQVLNPSRAPTTDQLVATVAGVEAVRSTWGALPTPREAQNRLDIKDAWELYNWTSYPKGGANLNVEQFDMKAKQALRAGAVEVAYLYAAQAELAYWNSRANDATLQGSVDLRGPLQDAVGRRAEDTGSLLAEHGTQVGRHVLSSTTGPLQGDNRAMMAAAALGQLSVVDLLRQDGPEERLLQAGSNETADGLPVLAWALMGLASVGVAVAYVNRRRNARE